MGVTIDGSQGLDTDNTELTLEVGGSEKARIDSGGNLGIGTSSPVRRLDVSDDNVPPVRINRDTDFGNLVELRKSGTSFASIGLEDSHLLINSEATSKATIFSGYSGANETRLAMSSIAGVEAFRPFNSFSDNLFDLGSSSRRWKDLYLSGGVYLGGTGSANKLEDYEEGSFSPHLYVGSTRYDWEANSSESGYLRGHYTKIGNRVFFNIASTLNNVNIGASSDKISIRNLPFVIADAKSNTSWEAGAHAYYWSQWNVSGSVPIRIDGQLDDDTANMNVLLMAGAIQTYNDPNNQITKGQMNTNGYFDVRLEGNYQTND